MDKWDYIDKIRKYSNAHSDELIRLMDRYHKYNTQDVTLEEAKEYYEELKSRN